MAAALASGRITSCSLSHSASADGGRICFSISGKLSLPICRRKDVKVQVLLGRRHIRERSLATQGCVVVKIVQGITDTHKLLPISHNRHTVSTGCVKYRLMETTQKDMANLPRQGQDTLQHCSNASKECFMNTHPLRPAQSHRHLGALLVSQLAATRAPCHAKP